MRTRYTLTAGSVFSVLGSLLGLAPKSSSYYMKLGVQTIAQVYESHS